MLEADLLFPLRRAVAVRKEPVCNSWCVANAPTNNALYGPALDVGTGERMKIARFRNAHVVNTAVRQKENAR